MMTLEKLEKTGEIIDTACEGTCQLWDTARGQYVVLADNTVITRDEDLSCDPVFPRSFQFSKKQMNRLNKI